MQSFRRDSLHPFTDLKFDFPNRLISNFCIVSVWLIIGSHYLNGLETVAELRLVYQSMSHYYVIEAAKRPPIHFQRGHPRYHHIEGRFAVIYPQVQSSGQWVF